jgi:DNA-binding Lrp family transcriptional regulator
MTADLELRLLNDFQHDFPLTPAPFAVLADALGVSEVAVLTALTRLQTQGAVSRVGAVFRPRSIGASTLAALAVPERDLERVANLVSAYPEVNHNYQREHHYNLWFVVTAPDELALQRVLHEIEERSGCRVLFLPLVEDYHIDLGFDLTGVRAKRTRHVEAHAGGARPPYVPSTEETRLIAAIQAGLPLVAHPYAAVGAQAGMSEDAVIATLQKLVERNVIRRMGVVVRHHELGYRANAMVVWDIPDGVVSEVGTCLGGIEYVTLCYRRPRRLPAWRYNLFCMIHGRDRDEVLARVEAMRQGCGLAAIPFEVLFSTRRFKQCGARYARAAA